MSATEILVQLVGSVALLLWGLRMVQTGFSRGFGAELRQIVQVNTSNRLRAFFAGLAVTMLVQSSTATALITSTFARHGLVTLTASIAIILGADVGTTLVAQLLSFDLKLLPFVLVAFGLVMHRRSVRLRYRQLGRAAIGLGLMLFALKFILLSAEPLRSSPVLADVLASLKSEPLLAVAVAALLAWVTHSSLATVLLISSLAAAGTVPISLGLTLVLGANIGGTVAPVLATLNSGITARRVTLGNAALKTGAVMIWLPFVPMISQASADAGLSGARLMVDAHMVFNLLLALVFLPLVGVLGAMLERFVSEPPEAETALGPRYLDAALMDTPVLALNAASREVLNMATHVETMLSGVQTALDGADKSWISNLSATDELVDQYYEEIKFYVTGLTKQEMNGAETMRATEILLFATNMEHIADIVENILGLAERKTGENLMFSNEGKAEIEELHARVLANLNVATGVFMTGDVAVARHLLVEKISVSKLQHLLTQNHMERLRLGLPESIATSALHLDILRDLRRVHSHITAVAYPVLDAAGELRKSRLRKPAKQAD